MMVESRSVNSLYTGDQITIGLQTHSLVKSFEWSLNSLFPILVRVHDPVLPTEHLVGHQLPPGAARDSFQAGGWGRGRSAQRPRHTVNT